MISISHIRNIEDREELRREMQDLNIERNCVSVIFMQIRLRPEADAAELRAFCEKRAKKEERFPRKTEPYKSRQAATASAWRSLASVIVD